MLLMRSPHHCGLLIKIALHIHMESSGLNCSTLDLLGYMKEEEELPLFRGWKVQ